MKKIPPSSMGARLPGPLRSCYVADSGQRDRKSAFPLALPFAVLESEIERGEKLERPLGERVPNLYFADALERFLGPKICDNSCPIGNVEVP